MKSESAIRASLDAGRPDFSADDALEGEMPGICSAMWLRATNRICSGKDSDGQRAIIQARESMYDAGGNVFGSGLDSAAEYLRPTFDAAVVDALRE